MSRLLHTKVIVLVQPNRVMAVMKRDYMLSVMCLMSS